MMQVLLEWSVEQYEAQFSLYRDNIAGKSFEKRYICMYTRLCVCHYRYEQVCARLTSRHSVHMGQWIRPDFVERSGTTEEQRRAVITVMTLVMLAYFRGKCLTVFFVTRVG